MDKFWKLITPSGHSWERKVLGFLRAELPDDEPFRVWAKYEFSKGSAVHQLKPYP